MSDARSFLEAIARDPDDDTARLVYADWQEEQGRWQMADCVRRGVAKRKPPFVFAEGQPAVVSYTSERRDESRGQLVSVELAVGIPGVRWAVYKGTVLAAMCSWGRWLGPNLRTVPIWSGAALESIPGPSATGFPFPEVWLTTRPDIALHHAYADVSGSGGWWGIPGRQRQYDVPAGVDAYRTVLHGEFPQVGRWYMPERVQYRLRMDGAPFDTQAQRQASGTPATVNVEDAEAGDTVQTFEGRVGRLATELDGEGYGLVLPVRGG
jgi:uncharacterized protein (TIGR02996 family)